MSRFVAFTDTLSFSLCRLYLNKKNFSTDDIITEIRKNFQSFLNKPVTELGQLNCNFLTADYKTKIIIVMNTLLWEMFKNNY